MAEEEEGEKFTITASDGRLFTFPDRDAAVEFAKQERQYWHWLEAARSVLQSFRSQLMPLTLIVPALDDASNVPSRALASDGPQANLDQRVINALTTYLKWKPSIHSRAPLQTYLRSIATRNPIEAAWCLAWVAYLEDQAPQMEIVLRHNFGAEGLVVGMISAWQWAGRSLGSEHADSLVELAQQAAQRAAALGDRAATAANTADAAAKAVHAHVEAARSMAESSRHWLDDFETKTEAKLAEVAKEKIDELDTKWKELARTYGEQLRLKAPSEYWGKKRTLHRNLSWAFAVVSGLFAVLAGWGLCLYYGKLPQAASRSLPPLSELLPSAVAAIVFLWILRTLMRLTMSHVHLSLDAAEREVMVQCYLAMTHEGETTGDERGALFAAIFRPTGDGLVKDETPPIPMWEMLKAAKPSAN